MKSLRFIFVFSAALVDSSDDKWDQTAKAELMTHSPSLNNLMLDEDDIENSDCHGFDDIKDCKEVDADRLMSSAPNEFEMQETYVHNLDDVLDKEGNNNCETKFAPNDSVEAIQGWIHPDLPESRSNIPEGGSQGVDNFDCGTVSGDPLAANNRRCSVEVHNLGSDHDGASSLTPVDVDKAPHQVDHKCHKSNHSVLQSIRSHIV